MHFYETCTFIICTHNIPNVTHTLVKFKEKHSCPNLTPMSSLFTMGRAENLTQKGEKMAKANLT
jgi:hypothetical protein